MERIYQKIPELLRSQRSSVLATIIKQTGSSPRGVGTKFLILEDGSYLGTIGGGLLEVQVLKEADAVFGDGRPRRLSFDMTGQEVAESDMLCGGHVEVFLEPVFGSSPNYLDISKRIKDIERRGGSGIVVTVVETGRWQAEEIPKMFIDKDGQTVGYLTDDPQIERRLIKEMAPFLGRGKPELMVFHDEEAGPFELFVEPVVSEPVLYIFGGGHVSLKIVPLAAQVGFHVVVIDDRPEFADQKRFPGAKEVLIEPFAGVMEKLPINESAYVVIVTRGHIHDKIVLGQALTTEAKYVGMIGSRRKRDIIYQKLMEEGFTKENIGRVYSPIGLDIGAETPEEIAVSIVGELIKVRADVKEA